MRRVLLDTNVVSELARQRPDEGVVSYLRSLRRSCLSVVTLHELENGVARLPAGERREGVRPWMEALLDRYAHAILPVEPREAAMAARLRAEAAACGRTLDLADALIAGTARVHGLAVATRNVDDFRGLDIELVDPWSRQR